LTPIFNHLIFALGPITGLSLPGSGRNSVGAKSPLTAAFGEPEVGGYINDLSHAAGRCGLGAVMGSKKLKAIAARGKNAPEMFDPEKVKGIAKWMVDNYKNVVPMWEGGTCRVTEAFNLVGNLPTQNFTLGFFEGGEKISGEALHEAFEKGMHGCFACPVNCKTKMQTEIPMEERSGLWRPGI